MKIYQDIIIGSPEWIDLDSASEVPAMLGLSSYTSRTELLTLKKTGIAKEVDSATQARFDKGHAVEALARPIIEKLIDDDLYPVSGSVEIDGLELYSSFDGLTISETIVFEHKLMNAKLKQYLAKDLIPEEYIPQLEQQLLVSGAKEAIFVASDGTEENMLYAWYESDPELRQKIIDGWKQFNKDLKTFDVPDPEVKPEGISSKLPVLSYKVTGQLITSNINECINITRNLAKAEMEIIPSSDQGFADKEALIKSVKETRANLKLRVSSAENEFISFSEFASAAREMDKILQKLQSHSEKVVKSEKESIKIKITQDAQNASVAHLRELNKELNGIMIPLVKTDFLGAIKGKRNLTSMRDAVDTELARVKIEADSMAKLIRSNLAQYKNKAIDHKFLFNDLQGFITNDPVSFAAIVDSRITKHKEAEKIRLEQERERIRIEEQRKAEHEAQVKLDAERKAIRKEERKKAQEVEEKRIKAESAVIEKQREEINKVSLECAEASKTEHVPEQLKPVLVEQEEETITISMSEYNKLKQDSTVLNALIDNKELSSVAYRAMVSIVHGETKLA